MSKILKVIGDGFKTVGRGLTAMGRAIVDAVAATGSFLRRHWAATAAVVLGLIVFAAVTAALVFFWPATIGAIAGFSIALPAIGTFAPFAFLSTLSIPAAAAVVGAFAFGATLVGSAVINMFAAAYNGLDRFFNPAPRHRDGAGNDPEFRDVYSESNQFRELHNSHVYEPIRTTQVETPRRGPGAERDYPHTQSSGFRFEGQRQRIEEETVTLPPPSFGQPTQ